MFNVRIKSHSDRLSRWAVQRWELNQLIINKYKRYETEI